MLDIERIQEVLPHRYPLLLVDRIIELKEGESVVGIKNVTRNEEFFNGHYPGHPIMPGVLIVEAMAQVAGFAMLESLEEKNRIPYFAGIDRARFRKPVIPGDQLFIEIEILKLRARLAKARGEVKVEGKTVAEATLMFAFKQIESR